MIINYKEPYWIKYEWDLSDHKDDQYVTEFNKTESDKLYNLFHQEKYSMSTYFKLNHDLESDPIYCIFGKPGKNFGLTYNHEVDTLAFEFWTHGETKIAGDEFHYLPFKGLHYDELKEGVVITIIRNEDEFSIYKNFEFQDSVDFPKNLIDDYRGEGLLIGAANVGTLVPEHRYYGGFEIDRMQFIEDNVDIEVSKKVYETDQDKLIELDEYNNIVFSYDFNVKNNQDIILDNSKNTYFVERIPESYLNI
jgi:hypothetical protein